VSQVYSLTVWYTRLTVRRVTLGFLQGDGAGLFRPTPARHGGILHRDKGRTVSPYLRYATVGFSCSSLEVPLNLGTEQPAIVRLGIGRRTESAGIATFLDRSG
jgi:hypothetical protein